MQHSDADLSLCWRRGCLLHASAPSQFDLGHQSHLLTQHSPTHTENPCRERLGCHPKARCCAHTATAGIISGQGAAAAPTHADVVFALKAAEGKIRSDCSCHEQCLHCFNLGIGVHIPGALHPFVTCNHANCSTNRAGAAGNNAPLCSCVCSGHNLMDFISPGPKCMNLGCVKNRNTRE